MVIISSTETATKRMKRKNAAMIPKMVEPVPIATQWPIRQAEVNETVGKVTADAKKTNPHPTFFKNVMGLHIIFF